MFLGEIEEILDVIEQLGAPGVYWHDFILEYLVLLVTKPGVKLLYLDMILLEPRDQILLSGLMFRLLVTNVHDVSNMILVVGLVILLSQQSRLVTVQSFLELILS